MQQMINMLVLSPILDGLLSEVTEQQMEREGGKLPSPEKGEKLLGKINSVEAKRLYCAAKMAGAKAVRLRADAECAPDDNAEKEIGIAHV